MRIKKRIKWLLKPYFIWYALSLWGIQTVLVTFFPSYSITIKTAIKALIQVAGIILVLYSINANMLNLTGTGYLKCIAKWFDDFPRKRTHHLGVVDGIVLGSSIGSGRLTVAINEKGPIEDQVQQLIVGYNHMNNEIASLQKQDKILEGIIGQNKKELLSAISEKNQELTKTVQDVLVGDIRPQVLGLLLIFYSMLIEYGVV